MLKLTGEEALVLEPKQRKALLEGLYAEMWPLEAQINFLKYTCQHHVAAIPGDYYAEDKWRCDTAHCEGCGLDMGWYCPTSSDHCCHYDNGNFDCCDFCGMPDERK